MTQTHTDHPIIAVRPLGFPWPTIDPFLFCVHHHDDYPHGNDRMGPAVSLAGRAIGQDFDPANSWRMYHGDVVPGFPSHPHRGFETVTITRAGLIDHADSLGATARFGEGDVQWLTAGGGIQHSEMFPLLKKDADNPLELFQIWLNLPKAGKFATPHFSMFWKDRIPTHVARDAAGRETTVTVIAGKLGDVTALAPPPESWAARAESDVTIWTVKMAPGAEWELPPAAGAASGTRRMLYFFDGASLQVAGRELTAHGGVELRAGVAVPLVAGESGADLLLLQGRPIGEPVAQYGPFVMNTQDEIRQAFADYQRTQFGGWPWPSDAPVHAREKPRHAKHPDGREELPA
ncbi:MAG: pirin family protein [Planctomycetota bacterium]